VYSGVECGKGAREQGADVRRTREASEGKDVPNSTQLSNLFRSRDLGVDVETSRCTCHSISFFSLYVFY
jgi:hypothetical protein